METFDQKFSKLKAEIQNHRNEIWAANSFPTALFQDDLGRYTNHMIELKRKNSKLNSMAFYRRKQRNGDPVRKIFKAHEKLRLQMCQVMSKELKESKEFWRTQVQNLRDFYRSMVEIERESMRIWREGQEKIMEEYKIEIAALKDTTWRERRIYVLSGLENKKEWNGEKIELVKILPIISPEEEERCEIYLLKDKKTTKRKFLKIPDD